MSTTARHSHGLDGKHRSQRRARLWWRDHHWSVIGWLWAVAFGLGYAGFARYFADAGEPRSPQDLLYLTLQLFTMESGAVVRPASWSLETARFLAPAVAAYTGVRALGELFRDEVQLVRVRLIRGHVVVCGLGRKGYLLARGLRERGTRVVVIEQDEGNDLVEPCREDGVIVLFGSAADEASLARAGVTRARHLVAVCGDDGANADVAVRAMRMVRSRQSASLSCALHVVDLQLCRLLRDSQSAIGASSGTKLRFFNVYDAGAQEMLDRHPPFGSSRPAVPHLLVVGLGRFGESLVVTAARRWEQLRPGDGSRLRVTLVDRAAQSKARLLCHRHPAAAALCDFQVCPLDVRSPEFEEGEFLAQPDDRPVSAAYVCLDNDSLGLSTGLALRRWLPQTDVPVVVRMERDLGLASLLRREDGSPIVGGLDAFGLLDTTCTPERILGAGNSSVREACQE